MRRSTYIENYSHSFASPYVTTPMTHAQHLAQDHPRGIHQFERSEREACLAEHHFDQITTLGKRPYFKTDFNDAMLPSLAKSKNLAHELSLFFEGYEDPILMQQSAQRKYEMEVQRFKVTEIYTNGNTFTKYIGEVSEDEEQADANLQINDGKTCMYCNSLITDSKIKGWKNDNGALICLCQKCNHLYQYSLIDDDGPGSADPEQKKINRFVKNAVPSAAQQQKELLKKSQAQTTGNTTNATTLKTDLDNDAGKQQSKADVGQAQQQPLAEEQSIRLPNAKEDVILQPAEVPVSKNNVSGTTIQVAPLPVKIDKVKEKEKKSKSKAGGNSGGGGSKSKAKKQQPEQVPIYEDEGSFDEEANTCELCLKVHRGNFVCCDQCEQWHCQPCSGFTENQMQNMDDQSYICILCKRGRK